MQEDRSRGAIEHTLHGHTRAITDINFSAHHPDMLATCAVDGYVHCWDLRRPRQPVLSFCDWFAGATQVKWNRQDPHILASSHDRWLRIWDDRKGAVPLRSINAHESKIYGIDWNRTKTTRVVTCSLDKSIKFWDYGNDLDEPERIIRTNFPVWRARHAPFGHGLLAMPQDTPGNLHLYEGQTNEESNKDSAFPPIVTFPGHGDNKVKDFLWRSRGGVTDEGIDNREFQLVSWGEDNRLRLQHVDPDILEKAGHVKGSKIRKNLNVTRRGAVYKTFRTLENVSSEKKHAPFAGPRPGSSGLKVSALGSAMKKMTLPQNRRAHGMVRAPIVTGKERGIKPDDPNQKQIGWMSGIKFNKQETSGDRQRRASSRKFSLLNPDFEEDRAWTSPESLHDEIIRIHDQLPKITFDDVNMDQRTVVVSMNGPWGEEGNAIYIKVTIIFPDQYPDTKPPLFNLGKTSLMSDEVHHKLKREVQQIASGFVTRRQGCLEAVLCYLLGEVDLEASTTFFKDVRDIDDDLDALADESSSDDEDADIPAGASAMMSQELDSSATGDMFTPINRNANVPLPRFCGARFSADGRLVCFFPPKEDKVKSLLETLVAKNNARSRGEPSFETFGRLNSNTSPIPRIKTFSLASEARTDSEASDESDISSSSDSDSSNFRVARFPMSDYFRRSGHRAWGRASPTVLSQKSSAAGTGTGTGATGVGGRNRPSKPKNIISLHNIAELIPSKLVLAEEYAIFGEGPDICEHNAAVAEKHGFRDLADIWRYAAMLLHNEVPLEVLSQSHHHEPILVIARDTLKRHRSHSASDSGIDISYDTQSRRNSLSGRVKWGHNPLAKQFISDLFDHFEQLGDIQMLAMLSCVFNEPESINAVSRAEVHMTQPQTPLSMKTPAFSLDYFPTDAAAWSKYLRTPINSVVSTPKIAQTPSGLYGSLGSSNGAWGSDPASASYSCGETPPLRSNRGSQERLAQHTQSLSTSPDNPRSLRRAHSALASTFSANFPRSFSITASSSPPNPPSSSRKRPSPVENMLSSAITWGNTTVLGSVKEQYATERPSSSDDGEPKPDWKPAACTGISLTMENQNAFDDEGCMSTSLLDSSHSGRYASYRRAYAELLFLWGHPLASLEVLKFNGLKDFFSEADIPDNKSFASLLSNNTHTSNHEPPSPMFICKKDYSHPLVSTADQGLDITGYCLKHDIRLEPLPSNIGGGAVGRCERCKTTQRQLRCTICMEPISALFTPCLSCGCATHQHCLLEYQSYGNTECPGGCDCDCGAKASLGFVESWEVLTSAIERMRLLDKRAPTAFNKGKEPLDEWDGEGRTDWDNIVVPAGTLGMGYSTFSKRLGQVRTGDWGMTSGKKKASSLRKERIF